VVTRSFIWKSFFAATVVTVAVSANGCLADKRTLTIGPGDAGSTDDGPRPNPEEDAATEPGETLPCDPVKQTGCLETRKCTLDSKNKAVCGNNGTRRVGQSCAIAFPDTCIKGTVCNGPTTASTFCRQFCSKTADCTQPAPAGQPTNDPVCAFEFGSFKVCSTPCNPVPKAGPSGCVSGVGCVFGNLNGVYVTDCNHIAGAGTNDAPCTKESDCADGYLCTGTKCRAYCRNGFDTDCVNNGYTCEAAIGAGQPFGVCCPPSPAQC
jgi:hypothetical protein